MRQNPLKRIVELQKQGKNVGIYSVCSANGYVIEAALKRGLSDNSCVLIESTANQCDQNGGYTGMKPADFKKYVLDIAEKNGFDQNRIFLGGDHLGPLTFAYKDEPEAMADAEELIREVTGIDPTEETIIDFSRVSYTKTFEGIIKYILQTSLHDTENPILRHVYTNLLDIGQLLAQHFYGFFANKQSEIKTYLYIAWTLWAYLVHEEQTLAAPNENGPAFPIYGQLSGKEEVQVITFNYTMLAATASPTAIYFNGNLTGYVDIENKNDLQVEDIHTLDLVRFFQDRLAGELSLEGDRIALPIPSFMPPLKLKPVITGKYVTTWYRTAEAIARAERILVVGHSLRGSDAFFNDMLRANRRAEIILIDRDLETACKDACATFQQPANRYTPITVQGYPARKYDNRITVIGADLKEIDLEEWLD